jgi:hypothetical protein
MINKLKVYAESFPSLNILEKYSDKIDVNNPNKITEVCSIYLVIELLNLYYNKFDFPLFKVYKYYIIILFMIKN